MKNADLLRFRLTPLVTAQANLPQYRTKPILERTFSVVAKQDIVADTDIASQNLNTLTTSMGTGVLMSKGGHDEQDLYIEAVSRP